MDTRNPSSPVVLGGGGRGPAEATERDDEPTPPEDIPDAPRGRPRPVAQNRNIFERLFGE
jgi:hypothetical protein